MADSTLISWTHSTFNPWIGCSKISAGCQNCYAETLAVNRMGLTDLWGPDARRQKTSEAYWKQPLKWNREANGKPHRVFVGSMCDVFEGREDLQWLVAKLLVLIQNTRLTWQLLTKRPENIAGILPCNWSNTWNDFYSNIWIGATIESADTFRRAQILTEIPATIRFISYEPALGPPTDLDLTGIDWVIYGGESGPNRRPDKIEWARELRDMCRQKSIPFFYKQASAFRPGQQHLLDGELIQEFPAHDGGGNDG